MSSKFRKSVDPTSKKSRNFLLGDPRTHYYYQTFCGLHRDPLPSASKLRGKAKFAKNLCVQLRQIQCNEASQEANFPLTATTTGTKTCKIWRKTRLGQLLIVPP